MLVRESISFERYKDPKSALGLNPVEDWLKEMRIRNYSINDDMSIDVNGEVDLRARWIQELNRNIQGWKDQGNLPEYIQFRDVFGDFHCQQCGFTLLKGCPIYVEGSFYASSNNLESFEYCPKHVMGDFYCYDNIGYKLKTNDEKYLLKHCKIRGKVGLSIYP